MVRAITAAAWALALLAGARGELLDLTPAETFYEVEGIRVPNVSFRNGRQPVPYTPPGGWKLSGGGRKLTLTPPDVVQASATIETAPMPEPLPAVAQENVKAYAELVLALVPRGATKVEVLEALVCPLRIAGKSMIEVTAAYVFFGQPFRMNVLLMPREKEQLRFTLTARAADYPELARAFRDSLFSMQGL